MDGEVNFEQVLETDIQKLAIEVQKHRESPEMKSASDMEILKQAIKSVVPSPASQPTSQTSNSPLPAYAQNAPTDTKLEIEYLLDLALKNGIQKAVHEAAKSNPFVLDAFHDALVEKLYPELQRRGIMK
jgi:hypothetical protein